MKQLLNMNVGGESQDLFCPWLHFELIGWFLVCMAVISC